MYPPKVTIYTHLAAPHKLKVKRDKVTDPKEKARLDSIIATYHRLYE